VAAAADALLGSAHDCGDGGVAVALTECAIGAGHGFAVSIPTDLPSHVALFSESASRAVVSVASLDEEAFRVLGAAHGVPVARIGETGGPRAVRDSGWASLPIPCRAASPPTRYQGPLLTPSPPRTAVQLTQRGAALANRPSCIS